MADVGKKSAAWIWAIFAALFATQGVIIAALAPAPSSSGSFAFVVLGFSFGFLFGAVSVLAIWTALETARYRIPISLVCNSGIAVLFSAFVLRTNGPWSVVAITWVTVLFVNLIIQGPLWFLRLRSGYVLKGIDDNEPSEQIRTQFSIGNMLVLTTVVAIIVAGGEPLLSWIQDSPRNGGTNPIIWIMIFLLFSLGATTTTLGSLWFMYSRKVLPLFVSILVWAGFNVASLCQVESLGSRSITDTISFSITCNVVAAAMVCIPLVVLSLAGRRLAVGNGSSQQSKQVEAIDSL